MGEDCDDSHSDSGLVTQFCTVEGNINSSTETLGASVTETPIEKEIRKSIAREQSLRRSRGLPNLPSAPEYVEVNLRKNVLSQSHAFKSERFQGKDRQFAGKKMLQDIYEEAQREEDLVRIGKVLGFYDKGTVRQLKERKHVFEAFQKPSDSTPAPSMRSKTSRLLNRSSSGTAGHGGVTRLLQQNNHDMVEKEVAQENPFIKLRSSSNLVKGQQDIHEAQEREKELQKQRISLYGGKAGAALVEDMMPSMSATRGLAFADLADSEFGRGTEPSAGWCRYEHSFRILTRKNPLVQRWESGQVNGHQEDED
uniref:MISP family member 3 n=1 Tax=Cynoglossus semilaevis TaxID=244447 RepID=A0A3P8W3R5_CYNSE